MTAASSTSLRRLIPYSFLLSSLSSAFAPVPICLASRPTLQQHRCIHPSSVLRRMTSSGEEKSYIDKLALILINSNRQQLVARSYNKTVFYTPGGKREPGESDKEALIRECIEELSVDLTSTKTSATIEPYGTFEAQAYGKPEGTMVRITCLRVTPRDAELELEDIVKASEEVEELKWIDSSWLTKKREKLTVTGIMILDDLKEKDLID